MAMKYSVDKSGDALVVWIDGNKVLENYENGYGPNEPHMLTEASTLLSGFMALAAVNDGIITLDEPVSDTITEWKKSPKKSKITVSELLHSISGLESRNYKNIPTFEEAISSKLVVSQKNQFRFGPTAFQVFGALIKRKAGIGYLKRRVLEPLGIPGARWLIATEKTGATGNGVTPRLFDGAHLTARELGRLGNLILKKGYWNKKPFIDNLGNIAQPTPTSPGFGLGVWLNAKINSIDHSFLRGIPENIIFFKGQENLIYDKAPSSLFMVAGRYNQRLYVIPSQDMVIVRFGKANLTWNDSEFLARLLYGKSLLKN